MRLEEFALISPLVVFLKEGGGAGGPQSIIPDGDVSRSWPLPVYTDDAS